MSQDTTVNSATRQSDTTNAMVDFVVAKVKEVSGKTISRDAAKAVYRGLFEKAFRETAQTGNFKLPWGLGQFYLVVIGMNAKPRTLPGGVVVQRKPKPTIRYTPGESVKEILGTKSPARQRRPPRNSESASVE